MIGGKAKSFVPVTGDYILKYCGVQHLYIMCAKDIIELSKMRSIAKVIVSSSLRWWNAYCGKNISYGK